MELERKTARAVEGNPRNSPTLCRYGLGVRLEGGREWLAGGVVLVRVLVRVVVVVEGICRVDEGVEPTPSLGITGVLRSASLPREEGREGEKRVERLRLRSCSFSASIRFCTMRGMVGELSLLDDRVVPSSKREKKVSGRSLLFFRGIRFPVRRMTGAVAVGGVDR